MQHPMVIAEERKQPSAEGEFAYLKVVRLGSTLVPHIVAVGQRSDGRGEFEERRGAPPPNQGRVNDENVMRVY